MKKKLLVQKLMMIKDKKKKLIKITENNLLLDSL